MVWRRADLGLQAHPLLPEQGRLGGGLGEARLQPRDVRVPPPQPLRQHAPLLPRDKPEDGRPQKERQSVSQDCHPLTPFELKYGYLGALQKVNTR